MNKFEEMQKELMKFGLSKNQAKIYLLLVEHKELRIQEIVSLTHIPRSSVYADVKKLYEFGIAEEIVDDHFKKIRPYTVGVMRHGLDEKRLEIQRLTNDLEVLEKAIDLEHAKSKTESTSIRYYKGRTGARQLYWNTLRGKDVYVFSDWGAERYVGMKFYEEFVIESRLREVDDKVLINPTHNNLESIRKYTYPGSPISRTKMGNIRAINEEKIPIKGNTFIYNNVFSQVYLKSVEINGFEIESDFFVATQRSIFEVLWNIAQPITMFL